MREIARKEEQFNSFSIYKILVIAMYFGRGLPKTLYQAIEQLAEISMRQHICKQEYFANFIFVSSRETKSN